MAGRTSKAKKIKTNRPSKKQTQKKKKKPAKKKTVKPVRKTAQKTSPKSVKKGKKKGRSKKGILITALVLVFLLAVGVIYVLSNLDILVKMAIIKRVAQWRIDLQTILTALFLMPARD